MSRQPTLPGMYVVKIGGTVVAEGEGAPGTDIPPPMNPDNFSDNGRRVIAPSLLPPESVENIVED